MAGKGIFAELDPIFHPGSVALIGASGKAGKIGRLLMERFLEAGFPVLYPVNPAEKEILGVKAFPTVTAIPGPVDLALVLTPTASALRAVEECAAKGVKAVVVTTAGFSEAGEEGKRLEEEMVRAARRGGSRIIGPNCVGIYSPAARLPYPAWNAGKEPGSVGLVSQSGFFADYLSLLATGNGIALSKAVSCGNEADLTAVDFLEYLGADPETRTIVGYLEGMKEGRRFFTLARDISRRKPIILWKAGATEAGARAAVSHTGALAGFQPVWEGVMRQAGIIGVKTFEEVVDALYALHLQPLPKGRRVALVSGPGGMAVGTTDMCLLLGLEVPQFSEATVARLREALPPVGGSPRNPIDLSLTSFVAPRVFGDAIRILAEEEVVDMLLVISVVGGEQTRDIILEAMGTMRKPIALALMAGTGQSVAHDTPLLLKAGIPVYPDPARAARALARLWEYGRFRARSGDSSAAGAPR